MHKDAFSLMYISLPSDHSSAISKVDETEVRTAVRKCQDEERVGPVHDLGLSSCGLYVATKLQRFKQTIAEYSRAKPMLSAIVLGRMPCVPGGGDSRRRAHHLPPHSAPYVGWVIPPARLSPADCQ